MKRFSLNSLRPVSMQVVKAAVQARASKGAVEEIRPEELQLKADKWRKPSHRPVTKKEPVCG